MCNVIKLIEKMKLHLQKHEGNKKEITVLDPKRSNAINIGMTVLPPPRTIKAAILKMDNSIINREGIEVRGQRVKCIFVFKHAKCLHFYVCFLQAFVKVMNCGLYTLCNVIMNILCNLSTLVNIM